MHYNIIISVFTFGAFIGNCIVQNSLLLIPLIYPIPKTFLNKCILVFAQTLNRCNAVTLKLRAYMIYPVLAYAYFNNSLYVHFCFCNC